jgi:hypothetical protein
MEYLLNHPWRMGVLLLLVLMAVDEIARRTGVKSELEQDENRREQIKALRDSSFVLMSLLAGFTLALSVPRYDERRQLVIDEANAIGTTYLRAGTLPEPYRKNVERLLREYVDVRLDIRDVGMDVTRLQAGIARSKQLQNELWENVIALSQTERSAVLVAFMNSLNEVIDLDAKRLAAMENRVPRTVWFLIFSVALFATFMRGMTQKHRFWMTLVLSPLMIALVVALIADLDSPRSGLIRVDQRPMLRLKADVQALPR